MMPQQTELDIPKAPSLSIKTPSSHGKSQKKIKGLVKASEFGLTLLMHELYPLIGMVTWLAGRLVTWLSTAQKEPAAWRARPRPPSLQTPLELASQASHDTISAPMAVLVGICVGSGVSFALLGFRRRKTAGQEALLG